MNPTDVEGYKNLLRCRQDELSAPDSAPKSVALARDPPSDIVDQVSYSANGESTVGGKMSYRVDVA